ncbi:type VI secretion system tip protein VgrG [Pseudomonas sp. REP124]|uniref:type VI secretion system Vgr family protein n=1 Tax=Pseudomonas sp. REP124 TaxID=2875731 RepID=UPI001CCF5C3D|nr:type VI secretion system tip protein TssI/VgrG [Pseudomonas sp. REP124]MBZ9781255.1 type VI secretion system tip protein VgrG [Pseudomonas sp. REP124]
MYNDKESPFTLTLLDHDLSLQVLQFHGHEALNQPYRFDIEALGLAPAMSLEPLLHRPAHLDLGHGAGFHGVLHSVSREYRGPYQVAYKLVLVPELLALDTYRARRVFERQSVPMILRQLLAERGLPDSGYRFELSTGSYPLRPFCIQYEETDLALLHRLCEEEGIHYHFEHEREGHVLVFADDCLSFPQEPLLIAFDNAPVVGSPPTISELFQRHDAQARPAHSESRERGVEAGDDSAANHPFNPKKSPLPRPGIEQRHREQLARRQLERLRCRQVQIHGQSNHGQLRSAQIVQVAEHPFSPFNDQWLVTQTRHQGSSPAADAPVPLPRYRNHFSAMPWSTVFRPEHVHSRPNIPGYQPARVCGVAGEPTVLDDRGRMQVNLWPTPQSDPQTGGGVWIPVALAASDAPLDPSHMPLAGSDGLVSFLDGDPDRPVFCASLVQRQPSRPARTPEPRSDTRLLLDWLIRGP